MATASRTQASRAGRPDRLSRRQPQRRPGPRQHGGRLDRRAQEHPRLDDRHFDAHLAGLSGGITDVNVTLDITHTYTSDLEVYLSVRRAPGCSFSTASAAAATTSPIPRSTTRPPRASPRPARRSPARSARWARWPTSTASRPTARGRSKSPTTGRRTRARSPLVAGVAAAETSVQTDADGASPSPVWPTATTASATITPEDRCCRCRARATTTSRWPAARSSTTADFGLAPGRADRPGDGRFPGSRPARTGRRAATGTRCQTARDGLLTVEMLFAGGEGVQMTLFDSGGSESPCRPPRATANAWTGRPRPARRISSASTSPPTPWSPIFAWPTWFDRTATPSRFTAPPATTGSSSPPPLGTR